MSVFKVYCVTLLSIVNCFIELSICEKLLQADLGAIAYQFNIRPRKRFDFRYPIEVITDVVLSANINEEQKH
jgi:hypothetical protein